MLMMSSVQCALYYIVLYADLDKIRVTVINYYLPMTILSMQLIDGFCSIYPLVYDSVSRYYCACSIGTRKYRVRYYYNVFDRV